MSKMTDRKYYNSSFVAKTKEKFKPANVKALAYYLPQFHQIPENNEWWGEGFTEWTNARKSTPLFPGHYQPREPHDDIGYYDLSDAENIRKQISIAKEYNIKGFCFYHYWFSGKKILEKPIDLLLDDKSLDIEFCIFWANENWTSIWTGDEATVLMEQQYSKEDPVNFIKDAEKYLLDERYVRINNCPVLIIYKPGLIPNLEYFTTQWRDWWRRRHGEELHLVGGLIDHTNSAPGICYDLDLFDALLEFGPFYLYQKLTMDDAPYLAKNFSNKVFDYNKIIDEASLAREYFFKKIYPTVMLPFDNTPRKGKEGIFYYGYSEERYFRWLKSAKEYVLREFAESERYLFIHSWNEWAEGTYIEPDQKYGYARLNTTALALQE